jgi:hypothetical protein
MPTIREPILHPVAIKNLRPTQLTVGLQEVAFKRAQWRKQGGKKAGSFLAKHMIPIVLGPRAHPYVVDHHHLARALHEEGVKEVLVTVMADYSKVERDSFWIVLDHHGWLHPFDARGRRRPYDAIPKSVTDLADDPFRSLAGALRRAGGYAKETTPFAEFLWADFFRRRLARRMVERDFEKAVKRALALAKHPEARYLPGWCGPIEEA